MCSQGNSRTTCAVNEYHHCELLQTNAEKTINTNTCEQELMRIRSKCIYVPLRSPKARRIKAVSFKFLSSATLSARTLRIKLQEMRPPLKDELISWNPFWS